MNAECLQLGKNPPCVEQPSSTLKNKEKTKITQTEKGLEVLSWKVTSLLMTMMLLEWSMW
jgi:hypothetical protein